MKKPARLLSLLLALTMLLGLLPMTTFAAEGDPVDVWVGGVQMKVGYYLPSGDHPTAASLTKTRPAGGYAYLKGVTSYSSYDAANLVLHDYSYDGKGYTKGDITSAIYNTMGLEIIIEGNNSLSGAKHGIYGTGDHCVIEISANSTADSLTIRADVDGIHTEKAFTMNNGTLDVSAGNNGIYGNYNMSFQNAKVTAAGNTGIASGQNIIFHSGTVVAEGNPNINSSHGLWAFNAVSMEGGTVTASGTRFGVECGNVEQSEGGEIYFTGGTLTAYNSYEGTPIGDYIGKSAIAVRQVFYSHAGKSYENEKVIAGEDASSAVPAVGQPYKDRYVKIYPAGDDDVGKDHLIPQNLRWNGKNAQWDAVSGASKYFVNFYCDDKQWLTKVVTDTKCEIPSAYYFDRCYQFTVTAFVDGSYHKVSAMSPKITYDNQTVKPWGAISSVAVNNTQEPVVGDKAVWTAPTLPTGVNYEWNQYGGEIDYAWVEHSKPITDFADLYENSAWYRYDDKKELTFQAGKCYTLVLGLNAKDGFEFAPLSKMAGIINDTAASLSDFKLTEAGSGTLVLYRTYGESSTEYITSVELDNAQVPVVGEKISWTMPTVPKKAGYEVGVFAGMPNYAWVEHDHPVSDYDSLQLGSSKWYFPDSGNDITFQADKYYTQVYWLDAKPGFAFAALGDVAGTINGTAAMLSDFFIRMYNQETMTLFRCYDKGCTVIEAPSAQYPITVTGGKATVNGVPVTQAAAGTTVTLTAYTPAPGKDFDKWEIVSGDIAISPDEWQAEATFVMPKSAVSVRSVYVEEIASVAITVTAPVAGQKASFDFNVAPGEHYNKFDRSGDNSGQYCCWAVFDTKPSETYYSEANWKAGNEPITFEAGKYYAFRGYLRASDGYYFRYDASATVNNQKADYSVLSAMNADIYFLFYCADTASQPFTDVKEADYFYAPVLWAVEKGITNGMTPTTFEPNTTCTRAQAVTFLWRANGSPEPAKTDNPFTDVMADQYYYKAVLWAVEKGITNGTSTTTFSPNDTCTRGQIVTFQWRAANQPAPGSSINPFTDVKDTYYYYNAVLWAVEKNITNGTTPTTFSPDDFCTRGQIVTFLYRQLAK